MKKTEMITSKPVKQKNSLAKAAEMKPFWVFFAIAILVLAISAFKLSSSWVLTIFTALLILGVTIFFISFNLAKTNKDIKLKRTELDAIVSNLDIGIIAYDSDFNISVLNRAAENILGVNGKDIIGKQFSLALTKDRKFRLMAPIMFPSLAPLAVKRSEPGAYPEIMDVSLTDPDLELRISTDKIIDLSGGLLGFVKLIKDRTREIEILRSKGEFITTASHQLRTPLTSLYWIFESLNNETLTEGQKTLVGEGMTVSSRALKIVNDLLDASKIEEGRFGYHFENANVVEFLEMVLKEKMAFAQEYGIKLYFQKPEAPVICLIDSEKLGYALSNLIDNAIKYNVKNGEVTVGIEKVKDKPYVSIFVKDTGIGVPADEINKLFSKFFRAENAAKTVSDGSGLGLFITKNIIRRHGGDIWAESELNRGTTFHFTLPTDPTLVPSREVVYEEEQDA
ncbi:MAG: ATP-binding protein [Candidatus Paceibacterota bacterium]